MFMNENKIIIRFDVDMKQEFEFILDAANFLEDLGIKGNVSLIVGYDNLGRTPFYKILNRKIKNRNVFQHSNFNLIPKTYMLRTLFSPYNILNLKDRIKSLLKYKHEILCHGLEHPKWSYDILSETEKIKWIEKSQENFKKIFGRYSEGFAPPCFVFKKSDVKILQKRFKYISTISRNKKIIFYKIKDKVDLIDIPVTIAGPDSYILDNSIGCGAVPLLDYLLSKCVSERSIIKYFERIPISKIDTYYFHLIYEFKSYKRLLEKVLLILTEKRTPAKFSEILKDVRGKKYESISYRCTL